MKDGARREAGPGLERLLEDAEHLSRRGAEGKAACWTVLLRAWCLFYPHPHRHHHRYHFQWFAVQLGKDLDGRGAVHDFIHLLMFLISLYSDLKHFTRWFSQVFLL